MKKTIFLRYMKPQRGMTLVELLIALALSLAVLIGLSSVYVAVKQAFRFQENTGRLQEDANFALDAISRELRMAGYGGCPGVKKIVVGVTTYYPGSVLSSGSPDGIEGANPLAQIETSNAEVIVQPLTSFNFIRGFDNVPSGMFASGAVPSTSGTDSLLFSGGSAESVGVSVAMAAANSPLTIASDPYGWRNATANSGVYNMIVSDCTSSSIFAGKVAQSGGVTTIAHDTSLGNSSDNFSSSYIFGTDATVNLLRWNFFYVATRAGASTPSLYRVAFNGNSRLAAEEIVSNVESMQLHYGENTELDGSGVPTLMADQWRTTAATVVDWSRVVAVRVGLMMVSADDNANPGVTLTTPTLLGQTYTLPSGASANRLRKEFSTTVVLRNSVAAR
jgi:type IV pilus assembly protein PilW